MNKNYYNLRCGSCGKFMKIEKDTSWAYVPNSDITYEENIVWCKKCTSKYGIAIPDQSVNISVCTGIHDE